jgi:arylsulfatase A-like enzyme
MMVKQVLGPAVFMAVIASGVCLVGEERNETARRPNVLIVLSDDQGLGDVGFLGNPYLRTPNLDAMAAEGVTFKHFLASPTCSPSRAALMTGRHEFQSGVTHTIEGRNLLRDGMPLLSEAFRAAGYRTAIFGKWHLGDTPSFHPQDRGFDHSLLIGGGAVGQTPDFWGNTMFDPHLEENRGWRQFDGYGTDVLVFEALRWMREGGEPWFCYLPLNAPHVPLQIGKEWIQPYRSMGLPERLARFYGMIENLDAQLGWLLSQLRGDGSLEETVVVFLGDNGTALGGDPKPGEFNAGLRGTKASPYQGGVRVPAIFFGPGRIAEGVETDTLAGLIDIFPTLAELSGLDPQSFGPLEGLSLAPILLSGETPVDWPDRFLFTHVARWPSGTPVEELPYRMSSIRDQRFSLVNGVELYDLVADPGESSDVAETYPEHRNRLLAAYDGWWQSVAGKIGILQPFLLGRKGDGAALLTCMDWQPSRVTGEPLPRRLWEQSTLAAWASGRRVDDVDGAVGGWMVQVETPGEYKLSVRQLPEAAGEKGAFREGELIVAIGEREFRAEIAAGDLFVEMVVDIPLGKVFFEPVLTGQRADGRLQGAYFCLVTPPTKSLKESATE